jgi:serine/threonine protein kinase
MTPFGKYTLVAKLAEGGMAEIHLAVEETPQAGRRFVIIKRIRDSFETDPDFADYFVTEGRVALKVAHPNLPLAYELGQIEGVHYLAMEFIRGPTLLDLLRGANRLGRAISVRSALTIARAVAAALEHAHGLRDVDGAPLHVIHRDVTPQNTLIAYDGTVKLIDFGIAQASVQLHQTATGVVKGKFSYLAPEQIHRNAPIDQRSDLFSLGVMMHEALCGRVLFRGRTDRDTIQRVLSAPIASPTEVRPSVPASLSAVVLRALARQPGDRYPSATALLEALEDVADREQLGASVVKLRDEVYDLCGSPQEYRLPTLTATAAGDGGNDAGIDVDFDDTDAMQAVSDEALGDGAGDPPTYVETPPLERLTGLAADADLRYYLAKAGVVVPSQRGRRLRTTRTDVEFSELLASLER